MEDYDDSSSIDDSQIELHTFKKEYDKMYLKLALLEEELHEKNLEIIVINSHLNSYKNYFYYALSGCVFWAYFSVITNLIKSV
jgi:hypothetical protein